MKNYMFILLSAVLMLVSCGDKENGDKPDEPVVLDAPSEVMVGTVAENSLSFSWKTVSSADSYGYKLLEGMTLVKDGIVNGTSITIEGLKPGTAYRFAVKAVKGNSSSKYSEYAEGTTLKGSSGGQDDEDEPDTPDPIGNVYESMKMASSEDNLGALAFPYAEGGGMYTTGGRGGKIYHVTTLEDTGSAGSLRYAVKQKGARTIVFDVAGIIHLNSPLKIESGDITIAGQTAPGDGICLADRYVQIAADNVIIRFLRFRLGDKGTGAGDGDDAIWGRYCSNIIIDHCSMSWSIDECASFYSNSNFTMQWCIIAESMKNCSIHTKGSHGYGGIWGGENASFHHNILAHHDSRNPRFDHPHIYENHNTPAQRGVVDYRNNVVYDWGNNSSYGGEGYGAGKGTGINMVSNYYKPGPSSTDRKYFMDSYGVYTSTCSDCGRKDIEDGYPLMFINGNVHSKYSDISSSNAAGIYWHNGDNHTNYGKTSGTAFPVKTNGGKSAMTTTHSANDALNQTCSYAGASICRDKVDTRITDGIKNGKGKVIDDTADLEATYGYSWPTYKATDAQKANASVDTDSDGIPDYYEALFGLNPKDASDASAKTIDKKGRYSNFEMYLHYLARDIMAAGNTGGQYTELK
ncbi:MAG: fibronectin type III domain-containing protein [Bacteroidales bacterium]|nr:fibronectin type III domain-containing protein [Bacteroidales bacterium]